MMKKIYVVLFSILYLCIAVISCIHAYEFFGLANSKIMAGVLSGAFEIGQAAVLFALLTSNKERSKLMPWVLMVIFTLVQIMGNIYACYKYILLNSQDLLAYFKEPIFIWTNLPDEQATVIVTYIVAAILPICGLLLTSMVTNFLGRDVDDEVENKEQQLDKQQIRGEVIQELIEESMNNEIVETMNNFYKQQIENIKHQQEESKNIEEPEIIENDKSEIIEEPEIIENDKSEIIENDKSEIIEEPEIIENDKSEIIEEPEEIIEDTTNKEEVVEEPATEVSDITPEKIVEEESVEEQQEPEIIKEEETSEVISEKSLEDAYNLMAGPIPQKLDMSYQQSKKSTGTSHFVSF